MLRRFVALGALSVVNGTSRLTRRGSGTVAGGRVALRIAPDLLGHLTDGRTVALVTGTNGKTTTTALLVAALRGGGFFVTTNDTGANMPPGHVAAVARGERFGPVVLETDEAWLPAVVDATSPKVVVLLNLSRDQLDRSSEVRMLAERWRGCLVGIEATVVANGDDPLVAFAARDVANVVWVAAGSVWHHDAVGCPSCDGQLDFSSETWRCAKCSFSRPPVSVTVELGAEGFTVRRAAATYSGDLVLPGAFNRANAAMALAAALELNCDGTAALHAMASVSSVAGRYRTITVAHRPVQLLLAKNPAGWSALLNIVVCDDASLIVALNARVADGLDPSWIWDVDFEQLRGREVAVVGDRRYDLAVRLSYAGVRAEVFDSVDQAVTSRPSGPITFIGNYTAFREVNERVES